MNVLKDKYTHFKIDFLPETQLHQHHKRLSRSSRSCSSCHERKFTREPSHPLSINASEHRALDTLIVAHIVAQISLDGLSQEMSA
jgi:hypothetical protein